jgi:hypothetical protein
LLESVPPQTLTASAAVPAPLFTMNPSQSHPVKTTQNNSVVVLVAALGLGAYAVYSVGDLQTVIYAVCGAYVLRLLMQNPDILAQLQDQLSVLHTGRVIQPVMHSPHVEPMPTLAREQAAPQPRLDMNFLEQTGYQPLRQQQQPLQSQHPQRSQTMSEYEITSPKTPIPSYAQFSAPPAISVSRLPPRTDSRTSNHSEEYPTHVSTYTQSDHGTITEDRYNLLSAGQMTPRPGMDPRLSVVSTFSAFPEPVTNPFSSYSHYDAGTIGGERLVQYAEIPNEFPVPAAFNLSERIAAPPQRPESSRSLRSDNTPTKKPSYSSYDAGNRSGSTQPSFAPFSLKDEYTPKRQHRKPTVAARVGEVAAPGGGIAPARTSSAGSSSDKHRSPKGFASPLVDSPQVTSPSGYDSDSSHASSSSGHSSKNVGPLNGHGRTESSTSSLGLPTYEKHVSILSVILKIHSDATRRLLQSSL